MKRLLLNFCVCVVFLAFAAFSFAAPLVQPVRTIEIPFTGGYDDGINIDGTTDTGYCPEQTTIAFNTTGSTGADADFTFSFRVAFNPMYFYIIGTILDDFDNSVPYTTTPNAREYDNVEIYLSLDTTNSTNPTSSGYGDDSNCIQLRINRGIDSIQTPGRATTDMYIHYWENTATGWMFETAIPWKCVLGSGQSKDDICDYLDARHGFDVMGSDSDIPGPGHLDCQTAWDMDDPSDPEDRTEDDAWTNRAVFGIFTFGEFDDSWWCDPWYHPYEIENVYTQGRIPIYPNPVCNTIHFQVEGLHTIKIYSLAGVKLIEVETTGEVDISGLKSGMYLSECDKGFVKFIKE